MPNPPFDADPHLVQLRAKVDRHFAEAVQRSPTAFACVEGCSQCCEARFSVYLVEARRIAAAIADLPEPTRRRVAQNADDPTRAGWCPLLVDERCSVYAARPIICRSHGLPVLTPDGELDHCPLNFTGHAAEAIPRESVLVLEAVDRPLAMLAELDRAGAPRVPIEELARQRETPLNDRG